MIYIRADMNDVIATGHVMRCMAIADAARELGEETTFIVADDTGASLFESRGYRYHVLDTDWQDMNNELKTLIKYLRKENARILLIDSYSVTKTYFSKLQEIITVAYIDDVNSFKYSVDALICYGIYSGNNNYIERYEETKLFLGPKYTPVRKAFSACPSKNLKEKVDSILILSGGTDNENVLANLLEKAVGLDVRKITVICGRFYKQYDALKNLYKTDKRVNILKTVDNIEEYMMEADIAFSAGGNTLYELCACGTPTISFALADNQFGNVYEFDRQGIILYAGDARREKMIDNADRLINKLISSFETRKEMSRKMQHIIDGKGAYRLAEELIKYSIEGDNQ